MNWAITMKSRCVVLCTWLLVLSAMWQMVHLSSVNTTDFEDVYVADGCTLNVTDFVGVQEQFDEYTTEQKVQLVDFRISGIDWSDSSNETNEIFDPNLLSWTTKESEALTHMPIDYRVLSFGLSKLAMAELEVSFTSFPPGCVNELPFEHQRRLVIKEVLRLTENDDDDESLICQSDYSRRIAGRSDIGVVRSCCTRKDLSGGRLNADCKRDDDIERFALRFLLISVFGFLLPFFIIPCALVWWQYNPLAFSESFTEYLSNRLKKLSIFKLASTKPAIRGKPKANGRFSGSLMVIRNNKLEPYETPVTILDLLNINMRRATRGKIKIMLLVLFQFVPVAAWLRQYSNMSYTLGLLDSTEKIVFNLHNNPYSWLWTDRSFLPFYIAVILVFLNFLLVLLVILWWLMEFEFVRSRFGRLIAGDKERSKKTVKNMFKTFFICLIMFSYISVYSLFNGIIYSTGALIVSVDKVSPWLTGAFLFIYYIHHSCRKLTEKYTEIKRVVFKVCGEVKTYEAKLIDSVGIVRKQHGTYVVRNDREYKYAEKEFEGPVWFIKMIERNPSPTGRPPQTSLTEDTGSEQIPDLDDEEGMGLLPTGPPQTSIIDIEDTRITNIPYIDEDEEEGMGLPIGGLSADERDMRGEEVLETSFNERVTTRSVANSKQNPQKKETTGIQKVMMSKATIRGVFDQTEPITMGLTKCFVKLVFTLLFLVLVVLTTAVFRPDQVTRGAGVIITSLSTLLAALIPRILEMMAKSTAAKSRLAADILELNVRKFLQVNLPTYDVIETYFEEDAGSCPLGQPTRTKR